MITLIVQMFVKGEIRDKCSNVCQRSPNDYIFTSSSVHFFYAWFTLY